MLLITTLNNIARKFWVRLGFVELQVDDNNVCSMQNSNNEQMENMRSPRPFKLPHYFSLGYQKSSHKGQTH